MPRRSYYSAGWTIQECEYHHALMAALTGPPPPQKPKTFHDYWREAWDHSYQESLARKAAYKAAEAAKAPPQQFAPYSVIVGGRRESTPSGEDVARKVPVQAAVKLG